MGVSVFAPVASGVYGISNASEWIYIGEADNIQAALFAEMADAQATVMLRRPTGFVFEVCDKALRQSRQGRLISEYDPICNRLE